MTKQEDVKPRTPGLKIADVLAIESQQIKDRIASVRAMIKAEVDALKREKYAERAMTPPAAPKPDEWWLRPNGRAPKGQ